MTHSLDALTISRDVLSQARVLVVVVGDDDEASHKLEALVSETGIRAHFGLDADLKTTVKLRVIDRQQQLLRVDFENTPKTEVLASQTTAFANLLPLHDVVLFSDYGKGGLAHISDMSSRARAQGRPTLIDPKAPTIHITKARRQSPPAAPSCSKSSALGGMRSTFRPRSRTFAASSVWTPFF